MECSIIRKTDVIFYWLGHIQRSSSLFYMRHPPCPLILLFVLCHHYFLKISLFINCLAYKHLKKKEKTSVTCDTRNNESLNRYCRNLTFYWEGIFLSHFWLWNTGFYHWIKVISFTGCYFNTVKISKVLFSHCENNKQSWRHITYCIQCLKFERKMS